MPFYFFPAYQLHDESLSSISALVVHRSEGLCRVGTDQRYMPMATLLPPVRCHLGRYTPKKKRPIYSAIALFDIDMVIRRFEGLCRVGTYQRYMPWQPLLPKKKAHLFGHCSVRHRYGYPSLALKVFVGLGPTNATCP